MARIMPPTAHICYFLLARTEIIKEICKHIITIFHPHGHKLRKFLSIYSLVFSVRTDGNVVINRYFLSMRTEIYKHIFAILHLQGQIY